MAYENTNKGAAIVVDSFDPKGTARQFKKQTDKFYKDTKDIMNGSASKESIYLKDRRISLENQIVDEDGNLKKVEFKTYKEIFLINYIKY